MREILRNLSTRAFRVWQRDADVYFTDVEDRVPAAAP